MKRTGWVISLIYLWTIGAAQEGVSISDTIQLEEFTITQIVPLNAQSILDISQSGKFSSIDKINERLEGISLIRRGPYAMEPQMDGFSAGQINVTVDGMKMFGACTDRMDPITSYIEPDNLESLSITHGTNGSIHGATVGGSFDLVLKEPNRTGSRGFWIEAGTGFESVSKGFSSNGAVEFHRNKWGFRSSGTYRNHNSYKGGDGNLVPYSYYRKINFHSVVDYAINQNNGVRFDFLMDDARDVGYPALPMDVGSAKARLYALEYKRRSDLRSVTYLKGKIYYNSVYHVMDDSNRDSTFRLKGADGEQGDTVFMRMDMPGWSETFGFYLEGKTRIGNRSNLYIKLDDYLNFSRANMTMFMNYPQYPNEPPMYAETWPDVYRNVAGLFVRNSINVSPTLRINLEGRLDFSRTRVTSETGHAQFAIFGYDIDWGYFEMPKSLNLYLRKKYRNILEVEAGAGYSERLPTNSEQFGFYLFNALDGYDYLGNPEIEMEKSKHVWGNLNFTWPKVKVSVRNRFSHIGDYIIGMVDPETPQLSLYAAGLKVYQNIPFAIVFGSGTQFQWKPIKSLTVYSLLKYTYGRTSEGDPLPMIPPLKYLTICKVQKRNLSIQFEGEFSSAQHRINFDFGEAPTTSYSVYNMRTSYLWPLDKVRVESSIGIENIFDKAYSEHLDWGQYLRPGRNIIFNISIAV